MAVILGNLIGLELEQTIRLLKTTCIKFQH